MSERQGKGQIPSITGTLSTGSVTNSTSSILDFSDHLYFTFQPTFVISSSANATGSVNLQNSLDQTNWFNNFTFVATSASSSLYTSTSKLGYVRCLTTIVGNITGSLTYLAGT